MHEKQIDSKLTWWASIKRRDAPDNLGYASQSWQNDVHEGAYKEEVLPFEYTRIDEILTNMQTGTRVQKQAFEAIDKYYVSNKTVARDLLDWARRLFDDIYSKR